MTTFVWCWKKINHSVWSSLSVKSKTNTTVDKFRVSSPLKIPADSSNGCFPLKVVICVATLQFERVLKHASRWLMAIHMQMKWLVSYLIALNPAQSRGSLWVAHVHSPIQWNSCPLCTTINYDELIIHKGWAQFHITASQFVSFFNCEKSYFLSKTAIRWLDEMQLLALAKGNIFFGRILHQTHDNVLLWLNLKHSRQFPKLWLCIKNGNICH